MSGDAMRHARDSLYLEYSLGLCTQCDCGLERVGNAMFLKELEEVCGVLVDDNILARYVDAEAVRGKVFTILYIDS